MLLQERNRRQPSKVVRFPQQHLEDTASYSHPPSSVFCHFSVRRRSSSSAAATDSTRVRLQVSPGRPYRPLLLLPPAWNYSCGLLDLWGCHSWKFITAKKTTHVLVEPKSPPTKTLRYEKYCSLSNSRAYFLAWGRRGRCRCRRRRSSWTLQYAQASADTKRNDDNDEETTTTLCLLNAYDSLSNSRESRRRVIKKSSTLLSPEKKAQRLIITLSKRGKSSMFCKNLGRVLVKVSRWMGH